jgi:hypothetical protein
MSSDLVDDGEEYEGDYEEEGVEAFNHMAAAMQGLQSRMDAFDAALGGKVAQAGQVAARAETAAERAQGAAERAEATARQEARQAASWAVLGAVAGILVAGGAGYRFGHAGGQENGWANGYRTAMDEKAAASWANTPAGQVAFAMERAGSLDQLARCNGRGWTLTVQAGRKVCLPSVAGGKGAADGWNVP